MMSDVALTRAHEMWLQPPDVSLELERWIEAQGKKKDLLKTADAILEDLPYAGLNSFTELYEASESLIVATETIKKIREQYLKLDEEYPADKFESGPEVVV
ncbi:MAG TPA: hypothetical protein VN429_05000 [Methanospirillum sp.]|uniref:hypothetical protein n=1 Tax=Methanospirillum sp. TaxID=45200 RepID=UPI002B6FA360|nr:hypothetical protein [Methanospirillum sp.]HWQ63753.1 hypothetical protein [Methanospirillum sp.]